MGERFYRREELVGKEVYDAKAMRLGVVKDIAYAKDGRAALVAAKDDREEVIPFQEISEIGDIVVLRKSLTSAPVPSPPTERKTAEQQTTPEPSMKICPKCQRENKPTAKFCVKCGSSL